MNLAGYPYRLNAPYVVEGIPVTSSRKLICCLGTLSADSIAVGLRYLRASPPRYARLTASSCKRSSPFPSKAIAPDSITYP